MNTEQPKQTKSNLKFWLRFDLNDDKATKLLVNYMKWWLRANPLNEEKLN